MGELAGFGMLAESSGEVTVPLVGKFEVVLWSLADTNKPRLRFSGGAPLKGRRRPPKATRLP